MHVPEGYQVKPARVIELVTELAPFQHSARVFCIDVRVSTPQLEDWLRVNQNELDLFEALHLFRVWCRRIRRGTLVGREYKPTACRIRLVSERGSLTIAQWGD